MKTILTILLLALSQVASADAVSDVLADKERMEHAVRVTNVSFCDRYLTLDECMLFSAYMEVERDKTKALLSKKGYTQEKFERSNKLYPYFATYEDYFIAMSQEVIYCIVKKIPMYDCVGYRNFMAAYD